MTKSTLVTNIPDYLIYEMDEGRPIYYWGYQEVLKGTKTFEAIMGDSSLQAWLKSKLYSTLESAVGEKYDVTVGEHGMLLAKRSWRSADIAIFKFEDLVLDNHYFKKAPEVVIEIDTKADYDGKGGLVEYYETKIARLLQFGVKKIIWIFTDMQNAVVITADPIRESYAWNEDIPVIDEVVLNIVSVFHRYNREVPEKE